MKNMDARKVMERPFIELPELVMNMKNKQEIVHELEAISKRAAQMARYIDYRYVHGCGDQGHESALKAMNKAGKIVWMKAFGYKAYHDFSF